MANRPAMDFIPRINEISTREEEMDRFKELPEFLDKFLKALLTIVSVMATSVGVEFSTKHPNLMMVTVFMIVLYFLLWLLGAMLRHRIQSLEKILSWIMLVIGSVSSVLVLTIINPVLACLASLFLLGIFAVVAYHNSEEPSVICLSSFRYNQYTDCELPGGRTRCRFACLGHAVLELAQQ